MKKWVEPGEVEVPAELAASVGGQALVAQTLVRRGIHEVAAARAFLDPQAYIPTPPGEMPGVEAAAGRLERAIQRGETICVWGDFDVDGQTSTTVLVEGLRRLGGNIVYHIPVRASESHGVGLTVLQMLMEHEGLSGSGVLLTCDTGISAHEAVEYARGKGVDVVITDHHDLPPNLPPALAVVNPKLLPAGHPLGGLPGVGVAYKLVEELYRRAGRSEETARFLDLAALGIVADLAVQTGETRYLLQRGLQILRKTERLGLQVLMELAELDPTWLSEEHIGYVLAPRLNSLGRLGDANPAVEFLTTGDIQRAQLLAAEMEGLNTRRKLLSDQIFQAALAQIEREPDLAEGAALVLAHPAWPAGVVGIVASQLVERFGKPTVLLSAPPGELARGSARSVEGVNITAAIAAQQAMLVGFGGHPMAAGLSIQAERIPEFRRRLSRTILELRGEAVLEPSLEIDGYLSLADLSLELVADLERLAPFGPGNPPLVLAMRRLKLTGYASVGRSQEHLLLTVEDEEGREMRVVWWQAAGLPQLEGKGPQLPEGRFDLAYSVRASTFRGQRDVQVEWLDARPVAEDAVTLEAERSPVEIVDYRREAHPLPVLQRILSQGEAQVWCEGEAKEKLKGQDRNELSACNRLVVWTTPPGRSELLAAIERVRPEKVYLFAVDPGMDRAEAFLKRLAGLVKHAVQANHGQASLAGLAAATAQRKGSILAGIDWLAAQGFIQVERQEGDTLWLKRGDGTRTDDGSKVAVRIRKLLEESAAYRAYYSSADPGVLLEMATK